MTFWTLIRRSLRYHSRAHFGVVLGASIGSAALTGALLVGDSVKGTLHDRALSRLGPVEFALSTPDRFFLRDLGGRLVEEKSSGLLRSGNIALEYAAPNASSRSVALVLPGTASRQDGKARANRIEVLGVEAEFWPRLAGWSGLGKLYTRTWAGGEVLRVDELRAMELGLWPESTLSRWKAGEVVLVNETLARQLNVSEGDEVILRVRKPSALALDAVISSREEINVAFRMTVGLVVPNRLLGDFSMQANQLPPANAFLPLDFLSRQVGLEGRANLLVSGAVQAGRKLGWWDNRKLNAEAWLWRHKWARTWMSRGFRVMPEFASLVSPEQSLAWLGERMEQTWKLEDAQLSVHTLEVPQSATGGEYIGPMVEVSSPRVFLDPVVGAAALTPRTRLLKGRPGFESDNTNALAFCQFVTNGTRVLTYVANLLRSNERTTPYSIVTAAEGPYIPAGMRDDEVLVNEWLAEDLQLKPGDKLELSYYVADSGSQLLERTNTFRVRAVVPLRGLYADRTLMPEFPGLAKAESTREWDTAFPLIYKIRQQDEAYWNRYRGTPKAFVTLAAGQAMWANRFGNLTAIRYQVPTNTFASVCRDSVAGNLLANLEPGDFGLRFEPVRQRALSAAAQSQDFGQLFLGFSFFILTAALLLVALLFQFGLEQRGTEVGTFLALGYTARQVRRMLLVEATALALLGGLLGAGLGLGYAKGMLWALTTIWRQAVGATELQFHATPASLVLGVFAGTLVALVTIWSTLRQQTRRPARELLAGEFPAGRGLFTRRAAWVALLCGSGALALVAWAMVAGEAKNAALFFCVGALLLLTGLAMASLGLDILKRNASTVSMTLPSLGVRGCARRKWRSLATIALLASGCFVIVAIGAFRLNVDKDSAKRISGTGGFTLIGEASLPVPQDLDTVSGRENLGLGNREFDVMRVVSLRVKDGDDASCLNLNRAQKPRILGVRPERLSGRFTFVAAAKGLDRRQGWELLHTGKPEGFPDQIPAIGDANSIQWALGKRLGDTLDYTDERGRSFKVRLVGAVANSILQGTLLVDETEFVKRFPSESYRMFFVDTPVGSAGEVSAALSRALQDFGVEVTPAARRLNQFNAVQNTYLGTFQVLGGLGLLLGSAGLGVVVRRNVWERRAELGLLAAVGFTRRRLEWMLLCEHAALLGLGLGLGIMAAAIAVLPALLSPATRFPMGFLAATLAAVVINGAIWTWVATRQALRGNLLAALRDE